MMQLRTVFLGNMLLLSAPGLFSAQAAGLQRAAEPSVTGRSDKRLVVLERLRTGFLERHKLPGAALAVARHGRLVYARGFG